jgi:hypothetical protein
MAGATDGIAERLATLFKCSVRWAYDLARVDVDALQAEKQAKAFKALAQGKSMRQAAREAEVDEKSVRRWTDGAAKMKFSKKPHPAEPAWSPADIPREPEAEADQGSSEEQIEMFEALAEQNEAEAAILREEVDPEVTARVYARINVEAPARHAHWALFRAPATASSTRRTRCSSARTATATRSSPAITVASPRSRLASRPCRAGSTRWTTRPPSSSSCAPIGTASSRRWSTACTRCA